MTDGNPDTRWISQPTSPANAIIDMQGVYDVSAVSIVFAADTIRDYTISISSNGTSWSTLASGTTNNTQKQTITHASLSGTTEGRYLRITATNRWNSDYGNSIFEVMAYGELRQSVPVGTISNFTATVASHTAINLAWAYSGAALTNYTLTRNGTTIANPAAGATTYNSTGLSPGTSYTYTLVGNLQAGGTSNIATRSATTTSPEPTGRGWLSGCATPEAGNGPDPAKYFGDWRGSPVEIGQTWPDTPDLWGINPSVGNSWAGFQGPMSLSIATHGSRFKGWAAEAGGANDAFWHAVGAQMRTLRQGKGQTFAALFYEFNGDWMTWSVGRNSTDMANFRVAFKRASDILRQEFPAVKIHLPATLNRDVPAAMTPDLSSFDLGGGTVYNAWPWSYNGDAAMGWIEAGRAQAQGWGKPIGITEWANSANPNMAGGGGDGPGFITAMHTFFNTHKGTGPGQVWYETFFNIDGYALDHMMLRTNGTVNPSQPNTANRYRDLF